MALVVALKGALTSVCRCAGGRRPPRLLFCRRKAMARHLSDSSSTNDSKLRYVRAEKSDFDAVLHFTLDQFRRNEPISAAVGLTEREGQTFIPAMLRKSLEKPTSTKVLNDDGELVAIMLASIVKRHPEMDYSNNESSLALPDNAAKICSFLEHMEEDLWNLVPKHCRNLIKIEIVSVRSDYTRKGIANKLFNVDRDIIQQFDCQGFISVATAYNSQQLFLKLGYDVLKKTDHSNWLDTNGQPVFKCLDKTDCALLVYKGVAD